VSLELDFGVSPEALDVVELLEVTELLDAGVSFELELDCTALDLGVSLELLDLGTSLELEFTALDLGVSLELLDWVALDWGLSLELEGGTTELEEAGSMMVVVFSESFNTTLMTWIFAVLIVSGMVVEVSRVAFIKSNMARNAVRESKAGTLKNFLLVAPLAFFQLISAAASHHSKANSNDLDIMISSELYESLSTGSSLTIANILFAFVES
jgi:hypothetical protein